MRQDNIRLAKRTAKKPSLFGFMWQRLLARLFRKAAIVLADPATREELKTQAQIEAEIIDTLQQIERLMRQAKHLARDYNTRQKALEKAAKQARPLVTPRRVKQVRQRLPSQEKTEIFQK